MICCLAVAACGGGGETSPCLRPSIPARRVAARPSPSASPRVQARPQAAARADAVSTGPWAIVRYGKLCHEYYPDGADAVTMYSATKTLGAVVAGIAAYETRDLPRRGRKTGPLSDGDRVDHWLDAFGFNPDALVAHVLAVVAHNPDLGIGAKQFVYDTVGSVQINRLSDIINTAIDQDPARFGADLEVHPALSLRAARDARLGLEQRPSRQGLRLHLEVDGSRHGAPQHSSHRKGVWNGRRISPRTGSTG